MLNPVSPPGVPMNLGMVLWIPGIRDRQLLPI